MSRKKYSEGIITLNMVRHDWNVLDIKTFPEIKDVRLITHEEFTSVPDIKTEYIKPNTFTAYFLKISIIYYLIYAIKLLFLSDKKSVIMINGGYTLLWIWCGILNAVLFKGRKKLFCYYLYTEFFLGSEKRLLFFPIIKLTLKQKEKIVRFVLKRYKLNVLWSKKQVETHAGHFHLAKNHFIFLPYKANHSKNESYNLSIGNYIFAGGNGKRDYECLIRAIKNTGIPTIISATDPKVRETIEKLPNVIVLGAPEPAFGQLQAASRFVVIPMKFSGLKGGGEANFCNGMWHKKPVVAVDSMSASDYIINGETGYVIAAGDSEKLRETIIKLWNDKELCYSMGIKAHEHVVENFTHVKFIRRILRLALIYGKQPNDS